jgi:hypothetical protein
MEKAGECIFCGQRTMVYVDENASEHEINRQATFQCKCDESASYRKRGMSIINAKTEVENIFSEMPDTEKVLLSALDHFEHGKIESVTITRGVVKAKVSLTSDNKIKVERIKTTKETVTL